MCEAPHHGRTANITAKSHEGAQGAPQFLVAASCAGRCAGASGHLGSVLSCSTSRRLRCLRVSRAFPGEFQM